VQRSGHQEAWSPVCTTADPAVRDRPTTRAKNTARVPQVGIDAAGEARAASRDERLGEPLS